MHVWLRLNWLLSLLLLLESLIGVVVWSWPSRILIVRSHIVVSWLNIPLKLSYEDLDEVHHVWSVKEVKVNVSWLLLGVVLPVNFISHLFLLKFPDFLHFVEVDVELLSVKSLVVKLILGVDGGIRSLEACESIKTLTFLREDLEALYDSVLLKQSSKFWSCGLRWEVLDVEIASLLGVLEL